MNNSKDAPRAGEDGLDLSPGFIVVQFEIPEDPTCPHSIPLLRKWIIVIIVCLKIICV
jgi:hypothetical protein